MRPGRAANSLFRSAKPCTMRCSGKPSMIDHLSIAARGPKHAADILAELMGGVAMPLPPNPGSFSRFSSARTDRVSGLSRRNLAAAERQSRRELCEKTGSDPFRAQRCHRRGHRRSDGPRGLAMLPQQPRPVPRDRGLARELVDGRNPTARIRDRISRFHPSRQSRGGRDGSSSGNVPSTPGTASPR